MAASMCDVFSFCVGVAGRARVAVEVRFVNSSKVRPGRTPPGAPTPSGFGDTLAGTLCLEPRGSSAARTLRPGPCSRPGSSVFVPAHRLPGRSRGGPGPPESPCAPPSHRTGPALRQP